MLEETNKKTIEELKTYLYSLKSEKAQIEEQRIYDYKTRCEENKKKMRNKEIQKIKIALNKEYAKKFKAKDEILELLNEISIIPEKMQKLEIAKYMIYRADIKVGERVIEKAHSQLEKRFNQIIGLVKERIAMFPEFGEGNNIDFSIYKTDTNELKEVKEKYTKKYTEEERLALVQEEIDIIDKIRVFNMTPIPHEILKNSDKDIQSKMQKFNKIRQKRLKIISTLERDYLNLQEPREKTAKADDATLNIKNIEQILKKSEYTKVRNAILRKKRKIDKSTVELRNIIKTKEKKVGVENYNIQEARYGRMSVLRNIISDASNIINENAVPGAEEQLEKLRVAYDKEKQFAAIIQKLDEEAGKNTNSNAEVKVFEEQIRSLEYKINNSETITKEQNERILKAKKELLVLWKIEIDGIINKRKGNLALSEFTDEQDKKESKNKTKQTRKKFFFKLKKVQNEKHACI